MDRPTSANGDTVQRQRLARLLRDPEAYFTQARREAREHARRTVAEAIEGRAED